MGEEEKGKQEREMRRRRNGVGRARENGKERDRWMERVKWEREDRARNYSGGEMEIRWRYYTITGTINSNA